MLREQGTPLDEIVKPSGRAHGRGVVAGAILVTGPADAARRLGELAVAAAGRLGRRRLLLVGGLGAAAVLAVIVLVLAGGEGADEVTADEFRQVELGMSEDGVRSLLGDPDQVGSKDFQVAQHVPSVPLAPGVPSLPPSTTQTTVSEDDCWFYPVGGETGGQVQFGPEDTLQLSLSLEGEGGASQEAVICFDEGHAVSLASGPFGPLTE